MKSLCIRNFARDFYFLILIISDFYFIIGNANKSSIFIVITNKILVGAINMVTLENIQSALAEALKQRTITQEELAKQIGVNQSMISHYITGRSMPALDTLSRICTVLDLDANDILCVERHNY